MFGGSRVEPSGEAGELGGVKHPSSVTSDLGMWSPRFSTSSDAAQSVVPDGAPSPSRRVVEVRGTNPVSRQQEFSGAVAEVMELGARRLVLCLSPRLTTLWTNCFLVSDHYVEYQDQRINCISCYHLSFKVSG